MPSDGFWKAIVSIAVTAAGVFIAKELIQNKSYFSASISVTSGLYYAAEIMKKSSVDVNNAA